MTSSEPALLAELQRAWQTSDELFGLLLDERTYFEAPIPLRHPFVFYLGHLPAFAWNQIGVGVLGRGPLDPELDPLFERGIDPPDEARARELAVSAWPDLAAVKSYRDRARAEVLGTWDAIAERAADDVLAAGHRIVHLVLEHELMHHETLVYMLNELAPHAKQGPPGRAARPPAVPQTSEMVAIPAGRAVLGADFDELPFGWDNEFPRTQVELRAFRLARLPVTVGEFREFVEAGGYRETALWRPSDRAWLSRGRRARPHGWVEAGGELTLRTMFGALPLDEVATWPAIVTAAEAMAYARWKGARLASEAELQHAALGTPEGIQRRYPWGEAEPAPEHGNFGLAHFDPVAVGSHPAGRSAFGIDELVGNGWEWTATDFAGFPGFQAWMRTYPGYSSAFFGDDHAVLYGAAWPTAARLLRPSFRNWFRRTYPWVFAKFRLARDA